MLAIIRDRDSGKAHQLLEAARENNAFIITQDKRAFQVKAHGYGFDDVPIVDYQDMIGNEYPAQKFAMVHNGDKMLAWFLERFGIELIGYTATVEE